MGTRPHGFAGMKGYAVAHMKTYMSCLFACSLLAAATIAQGQQAQSLDPVPVVIAPVQLQYKVIDLGRIAPGANMAASDTLELILNQMAAQGWKVVTSSGSFLILSRGV